MIAGNLLRMEVLSALADRRRLVLRIGVTLLLCLPFILVDIPARAQSAGIVLVVLFTGFFGTAVATARIRADGRVSRLLLLPSPRLLIPLDLLLAWTAARLVPGLVVIGAYLAVKGRYAGAAECAVAVGMLGALLATITLLGMAVGRLARGTGEVHLFGALAAGLLAWVSGLVPMPARMSGLAGALAYGPAAQLAAALEAAATGSTNVGPAAAWGPAIMLVLAAAFACRWMAGGAGKARSC